MGMEHIPQRDSNVKKIATIVFVIGACVSLFLALRDRTPQPELRVEERSAVPTRREAPKNVAVPEVGTTRVSANIAVPIAVISARPKSASELRSFAIEIARDAFEPDTIIVYEGDIVHMNVLAADKAYDFTQPDYGFKVGIKKGETKVIEFSVSAPGNFTFYCVSCGGPGRGPVGHLIVVHRD